MLRITTKNMVPATVGPVFVASVPGDEVAHVARVQLHPNMLNSVGCANDSCIAARRYFHRINVTTARAATLATPLEGSEPLRSVLETMIAWHPSIGSEINMPTPNPSIAFNAPRQTNLVRHGASSAAAPMTTNAGGTTGIQTPKYANQSQDSP